MRTFVIAAVVVSTMWVGQRVVQACGDKFLAVSRGTRFQRAALARRPANILVLAPAGGRLATSVQALGVVEALTKAGYTPLVVTDASQIDAAAAGRPWDLVIRELDTDPAPAGVPATAGVVVVTFDAPRDAVGRARKAFDAVIVRPTRGRAVVDAVDDALLMRSLRSTGATRAGN